MSDIRAFTMPKWGIEMTEGLIAEWKIAEGAPFAKGEILALIESDKITNEVEAEFDNVLRRVTVKAGETYPVGTLLAVFAPKAVPEAEIDAFIQNFKPAGAAADKPVAQPAAPEPAKIAPPKIVIADTLNISPRARSHAEALGVQAAAVQGSGRGGRITFQDIDQAARPERLRRGGTVIAIAPSTEHLDRTYASPMAKRLAVLHKLDLGGVTGTGPRGRISKADVLTLAGPAASLAPGEGFDVIRMSPMRKAIARRLTVSKTTIPHFYLRARVSIDALTALRKRVNEARGAGLSLNDFLVRACALALIEVPDVNIQLHGDEIHRFHQADIAVAVATDRGLLTPVIRSADRKSLFEISAEIRALAGKAKEGKLKSEAFEGGSFTLSNLGMFGIDEFDAVINQPQGAILAVGAARQDFVIGPEGVRSAPVLSLSLSCDHRAIDGAVGAGFLAALRRIIEAPARLIDSVTPI